MFCFFRIQYSRELSQKLETIFHNFLHIYDADFQWILSKFRNWIRKFFRFNDDVSNLLYCHRKKLRFFLFILRVCLKKTQRLSCLFAETSRRSKKFRFREFLRQFKASKFEKTSRERIQNKFKFLMSNDRFNATLTKMFFSS